MIYDSEGRLVTIPIPVRDPLAPARTRITISRPGSQPLIFEVDSVQVRSHKGVMSYPGAGGVMELRSIPGQVVEILGLQGLQSIREFAGNRDPGLRIRLIAVPSANY